MRLIELRLNNIRSYIDQVIEFDKGVTLLAGDVGAGKTSILLSLEFALFGLQRVDLTGLMLLRYGEDYGFVELKFIINNKEYMIKRNLKRNSDGVTQSGGFFASEDGLQKLSSGELKSKILALLNYPKEMLTKRSLIYRYTVYAVQEEMKHILLSPKDERVDILRKVFNIEKYKSINDNLKIVLSDLRAKERDLKFKLSSLEEALVLKKEFEIKKNSLILNLGVVEDNLLMKETEFERDEVELKVLKMKKEEYVEILRKIETIKGEINSCNNMEKIYSSTLNEINEKLESFEDTSVLEFNSVRDSLKNLIENKKSVEKSLELIKEYLTTFKFKLENSYDIKSKLIGMNRCSVCLQEISEEYKERIESIEEKNIFNYNSKLETYAHKKDELEVTLSSYNKTISELENRERGFELFAFKKKEYENSLNKIKEVEINLLEVKKNKLNFEEQLSDLFLSLGIFESVNNTLLKIEEKIKLTSSQIVNFKMQKVSLEKEIQFFNEKLDEFKKKEDELKIFSLKYKKLISNISWMGNNFITMLNIIEKRVLANVYSVFNSNFKKWFVILMGSEGIKVRLDYDFSPVIEQNGYDLDYLSLSGGERTACALAYRLALNQVINQVVTHVNTSEIIILDEPTDGFSAEQLDRVREVLEKLDIEQILIVSHEEKIESFCDRVIKIEKRNGESVVL